MKSKRKSLVFLLTAIMSICMLSFVALAKTQDCGNTSKVVVKIVWDDENNYDGLRKEGDISLIGRHKALLTIKDYEREEKIDITKNEQTIVFDNLPTMDKGLFNRHPINYELNYPGTCDMPGYEVSIDKLNGTYIIKYTHKVVKTNITVNSSWIDENNFDGLRKDTTFSLVRNTKSKCDIIKTMDIYKNDDTQQFSFPDLRTYLNGEKCDYSVVVNSLPYKYVKKINIVGKNEYAITLTHYVQRATVKAIKYWFDYDNLNKQRPESVVFELYADNEATGEYRTLASKRHVLKDYDTIWSVAQWSNLPMYKDGQLIDYTVKEINVPDFYKSEMVDNINHIGDFIIDSNMIVIKNTYDGAKKDIVVNVEWKEDTVETRPEDYKIQLKANGKNKYDAVSLTTNDDTSYTYTNVPVNYDGNRITYSIEQLGVDETKYTTEIVEKDGVFTIINTLIQQPSYEPETSEPGESEGPEISEPGESKGPETSEPGESKGPETSEPGESKGPETSEPGESNGPETSEPGESEGPETSEPGESEGPELSNAPGVSNPPFVPVEPSASVSMEPTVMPSNEPTVIPSEEVTVVPTKDNEYNSNEDADNDVTLKPTDNDDSNTSHDEEIGNKESDNKSNSEIEKEVTVKKLSKSNNNNSENMDESPKTEDNSNIVYYMSLLVASVCGMVALYNIRRKNA